jgi:DNA-directed RNA polymerase specialized sigma24 family protein
MKEPKRSILHYYYYEDMKQREIAEILGLNIKAIGSYIRRGIVELRKRLCNFF